MTTEADKPQSEEVPHRWLIALSVMMGTISTVLSSTIVNVALPDIMGAFGMGQDTAQWMSTGFLASMTATMLTAAWFVTHIGLRRTFVCAMLLFVASSVVAGLSTTEAELIGMRILQGAAAGVMQPVAMIAMFSVFPPHKRGAAMGIFSLGVVLAPAVGPTIGGILIDMYNWRVVFFFILPASIAGIFLGMRFLPGRSPDTKSRPFDFLGFVLLCAALVSLLTGFANGPRDGWSSAYILTLLIGGTLLSVAFILWQLYAAHPLLDLGLLRHGVFASACVVAFIYGAGLFGSTYLLPLFAQGIQRLTPEGVGLMLMPSGLILAVVFPFSGRASDRLPSSLLICTGLFIFGAWALWMKDIDANTPFWLLATWIAIGRVGLGIMLPALNAGGVRSLPPKDLSHGAGVLNFVRQLGGAFGTNLLSVLLGTRVALHSNALAATQNGDLTATYQWLTTYESILAKAGVPADGRWQEYGALHHLGRTIYQQAYTLSFRDCFIVVAILFFVAILPALAINARPSRPVADTRKAISPLSTPVNQS